MSADDLRAMSTRALCGLQRAERLLRAVERGLVLLPRGLHLRQALLVLRLRDDLLIQQRLDAVEVGFRPVERGLGVEDVGDADGIERLSGAEAEPRLELRGVGVRFAQRGVRFRGGDSDEHRAGRDAGAALHRRADDAAAGFGGDVGLLVGGERAGHAQETIDRLAFDLGDVNGHGRGLGGRGRDRRFAAARGGKEGRGKRGAGEQGHPNVTNHDCRSSLSRYECIRMRARR